MGDELDIRRIAREEAEKVVAGLRGVRLSNADQIQGRHASATAPTNQYYLGWNSTTRKWEPSGLVLIRKSASQTVNNNATLQDDDHLLFAVAANEIWIFELFVSYAPKTTSDIKFAITVPAGATLRWGISHIPMATPALADPVYSIVIASGTSVKVDAHAGGDGVHIMGTIVNGGTVGNLQLQWAQQTDTVEDTTVHENSWLKAHRIV